MDDCPEKVLKTVCCICLSVNRKLSQLCRIADGVNNLYYLLSYDTEAYREGFYKGAANLFICWECTARMKRFCELRKLACTAQKQLVLIIAGRTDVKSKWKSLSKLSTYHKSTFDNLYTSDNTSPLHDNFVDCGLDIDIKTESDMDDLPLSKLHFRISEPEIKYHKEVKVFSKRRKKDVKSDPTFDCIKYFSSIRMTDIEMIDYYSKKRVIEAFVASPTKCEHCIETFKSDSELKKHNIKFHTEKPDHTKCEICQCYIQTSLTQSHKDNHYTRHTCSLCDHTSYEIADILNHLKEVHTINVQTPAKMKKTASHVKKPGSKPRRNPAMMDKRTPFGYSCTECDKHFDNKNKRYKHIQRYHREGFKCGTCGKSFAFRSTLTRHELLHSGPLPREQCPTCGKMVRSDLARAHARTHAPRPTYACAACDKRFVSRASYEHHLKYTRPHATHDILKYKCMECEKGYRSQAELRDHVNYLHRGRTRHKCPVCDKALATRRCVTRHVRRAHHGVKENARDKICQTCGKAFRDKKGLLEHESIHTGERPLSCAQCGRAFRQSASLYTHRRRVHRLVPQPRPRPAHTDDAATTPPRPAHTDDAATTPPRPAHTDDAATTPPRPAHTDDTATTPPRPAHTDDAATTPPRPANTDDAATPPRPPHTDEAATMPP